MRTARCEYDPYRYETDSDLVRDLLDYLSIEDVYEDYYSDLEEIDENSVLEHCVLESVNLPPRCAA